MLWGLFNMQRQLSTCKVTQQPTLIDGWRLRHQILSNLLLLRANSPSPSYDGIESEGLCYLAKTLGFKCWAMPQLLARHSKRFRR